MTCTYTSIFNQIVVTSERGEVVSNDEILISPQISCNQQSHHLNIFDVPDEFVKRDYIRFIYWDHPKLEIIGIENLADFCMM